MSHRLTVLAASAVMLGVSLFVTTPARGQTPVEDTGQAFDASDNQQPGTATNAVDPLSPKPLDGRSTRALRSRRGALRSDLTRPALGGQQAGGRAFDVNALPLFSLPSIGSSSARGRSGTPGSRASNQPFEDEIIAASPLFGLSRSFKSVDGLYRSMWRGGYGRVESLTTRFKGIPGAGGTRASVGGIASNRLVDRYGNMVTHTDGLVRSALESAAATLVKPGQDAGPTSKVPYGDTNPVIAKFSLAKERRANADIPAPLAQSSRWASEYLEGMSLRRPPPPTGDAKTEAENYRRKAEAQLIAGDFFRAISTYDLAAVLDRNNPLLDLGKGHAMIGAGEYLSAVRRLTRALPRIDTETLESLDLTSLITDVNLLDRRRAELDMRLQKSEDYRLRFLLGYIEYFGGLRSFGVTQLRKAAADAPPDSVIARISEFLPDVRPDATTAASNTP